jgi:dTDP-4-dehydrorhamnose 3,5-epimerase
MIKTIPTKIADLVIIEPKIFGDNRGFFMETYRESFYKAAGIQTQFIQDNVSYSVKGTLRGMHFQIKQPQAKLVQVLTGEVFDVAVDLRPNSSTFGKWEGVYLSDTNKRQLYIPEGLAHGFCVVSDTAHFVYKCSDYYLADDEGGMLWSDPDVGIKWPIQNPILSEKDKSYPTLTNIPSTQLPQV